MPLATNPNALFEVVLESDKELPEDKKPVFIYRFLTGLQQIELAQLIDTLEIQTQGENAINQVYKAATIGLIAWKNVFNESGAPITFDTNKLKEIMGFKEALELAKKVFGQQYISDSDKKKSPSSSDSNTDKLVNVETAKDKTDAK